MGTSAELVYGAATPLTDRMSDRRSADVGGPMPFNGLFGMTPGAVVDAGLFWRGLWPFLFLAPVAAAIDIGAVGGIRGQVRRRGRPRPAR